MEQAISHRYFRKILINYYYTACVNQFVFHSNGANATQRNESRFRRYFALSLRQRTLDARGKINSNASLAWRKAATKMLPC